jgi:la-related protein 1
LGPDRRKFIDATTPTLIDEEDLLSDQEEEEMVSLAQERMRREMMMQGVQDESSLKRTPGASMYDAEHSGATYMRRTPGAITIHSSSTHTSVSATEVTDSALLGFGLTLSTPVAAGSKGVVGLQLSVDSFSSSSSSSSSQSPSSRIVHKDVEQADRPPRIPNVRTQDLRESRSYTPAGWTLSKNPHLEVSHGAFSPNTLRLTEDLDNLLLDDEDASGEKARQHVFRDTPKGPLSMQPSIVEADEEIDESWTAPYIFGQDGGQAKNVKSRRDSGKYRKVKNEGGRRSRGADVTKDVGARHGQNRNDSGLSHAHPKPLRQDLKMNDTFAMSSFAAARNESPSFYQGHVDEDDGPRPIHFGGAFVPPSKAQTGNFRRPVPSTFRSARYGTSVGGVSHGDMQAVSSCGVGEMGANVPQMGAGGGSQFYGGFRPTGQFQSMSQPHFLPQFSAGSNDMRYSSQTFSGNYGNETPPLNYGNPMYNGHAGQPMGFQGVNPYSMNAASIGQMQGQQQFSQQWPQMMPMNYNAGVRDSGWHGVNTNRGWGSGDDFGYGGIPAGGMMDARMHLTPSPQFSPWQDHGFGAADSMHCPPHQMNPQGVHSYSGFSAVASVGGPASQRSEAWASREPQQAQSKKEGREEKCGSRKQRNADTKKNNALKDKTKGKDAERKKAPPSPKKKKQTNARVASPAKSSTNQTYARKDSQAHEGFDDLNDGKRAEIEENPVARTAFKEFYRQFRAKERSSFKEAEEFAKQTLVKNTLPEIVQWRVHLELADLAKRSNRIIEARERYRRVCELQPYASQGWLEYSKLEEECGHLNRCARILCSGLEYCEYSESLLTRAIKHAEKMGNLDMARQLLARLKHVGIEKVWRSVLEGALLEARAGNTLMARRVLKYLMHHVPWYGPLYLEAYRLERDQGRLHEALAIVEKGLTAIPRYGPLWFGAFRLCEALDISEKNYHLPRTTAVLLRATEHISRELVWKIHLDASQILERAAIQACAANNEVSLNNELKLCRQRFAMTAASCPPNLCWKVWLASGRMELTAGNRKRARALFLRAQQVVPDKGRGATLLECARLEEFVGNVELARAILSRCRFETTTSDWKIWLESVLLEVRSGHPGRAIELAKRALETYSGTGRLWACLVQLRAFDGGEEAQFSSLKRALMAVPKSGEVWCEGGRIHLNPFSNTFDLTEARRHLFFATRFTPQYGDSFLETMKLEILEQWIAPVALNMWQVLQPAFLERLSEGTADTILAGVVQTAARRILVALASDETANPRGGDFDEGTDADSRLLDSLRRCLTVKSAMAALDNSELELRCSNADPNYGLLWFHSRNGPTDTARTVISRGREIMIEDITSSAHLYIAAMVRRFAIITTLKHQNQIELSKVEVGTNLIGTDGLGEVEALLDSRLRAAPSLEIMLQSGEEISSTVLLESSVTGSDFVTGFVELNKPLETLSLHARRKALFGSDALFS